MLRSAPRDRQRILRQAIDVAGQAVEVQRFAERPLRQRFLDHVASALMRAALWVTGNRY